MKTRETIIYGGAFHPPTIAHERILQATVDYAVNNDADVWILPSGNRVDKAISATRERRLALVAAMILDIDARNVQIDIPTLELDREISVETYDTVQELKALHPNRMFRFVFGADSTQTMASWSNGEVLLRELPMLVVERANYAVNPFAELAVSLSVEIPPNISSTLVRERMENGQSFDDLVGPRVAEEVYSSMAVLR